MQSLLYPLLALSSPSGDSSRLGDWNLVCLSIFAKLFRAIFLLATLFSAISIRFLSRVSDVVTFGVMTEKREETGSRFFEFSGDQMAAIAQIESAYFAAQKDRTTKAAFGFQASSTGRVSSRPGRSKKNRPDLWTCFQQFAASPESPHHPYILMELIFRRCFIHFTLPPGGSRRRNDDERRARNETLNPPRPLPRPTLPEGG